MADERMIDEKAEDGLAVAPPPPGGEEGEQASQKVRAAHDASDDERLQEDPADPDAKLDVALDETFPNSDAPAHTRPGQSGEPAESSGYDEEAEKALQDSKA